MTLLKGIEKTILIAKGHEYIGESHLDLNDALPHTEEFYRVKTFARVFERSNPPKQDESFYEALQLADLPSHVTEIIPESIISSSPGPHEAGRVLLHSTIRKIIDRCYHCVNGHIENKYKAKRVFKKIHKLSEYYGSSMFKNESAVAVEEIIRLYCLIKSERPSQEKIRKMILSSPSAKLAILHIKK